MGGPQPDPWVGGGGEEGPGGVKGVAENEAAGAGAEVPPQLSDDVPERHAVEE